MFNITIVRLNKRIDIVKEENSKIKKELTGLKKSIQYHSGTVDEVNKKLEDIDRRVEEIKLDEITEDFVTITRKKLGDLVDRICQNNLCFDGFQKKTNNQAWEESESITMDFAKEKLRIEEDISIKRAYRTWKMQRNDGTRNKKSTIVMKFLNFKILKTNQRFYILTEKRCYG